MTLRSRIYAAVISALLVLSMGPVQAKDIHQLVLQVSDNDPLKMTAALNVAANVSRHYSGIGEEVEIKILAFNAGLHMLREDTSPVAKRLKSFDKGMPNVSFLACGNTINAMGRKEGVKPTLFGYAEIVPAGVVTLIELDELGWTLVRP